jgi:hypothetical protein
MCVEVSNDDSGYLLIEVMVKEVLKAVPIQRYGVIHINKLSDYLAVFLNVNNN